MAGSIPALESTERRWRALRRAARARLAPFGAAVLLAALVMAFGAPMLSPHDPLKQNLNNTLARPGRAHVLGTDNVGRDVLSRVIWGTRVSLIAGIVSVVLAAAAGSVLGLLAGYARGRVDGLVMRAMDAVLSFPPLVLALALGAVLGAGLGGVLLALGVVYTLTFARLMRGQVLAITAREYVGAARARRPGLVDRLPPRGPERRRPDRGPGLAERGLRDPGRGVAVVSRTRHPAPATVVGQHDQRRPWLSPAGPVDRLRPGRGPLRHRGRPQLRG